LTSSRQDIFLLPLRGHDNSAKFEYGTHSCMLGMLRDQVWLLRLGVCMIEREYSPGLRILQFFQHSLWIDNVSVTWDYVFLSNTQSFRWFQINQAPGLISELNPLHFRLVRCFGLPPPILQNCHQQAGGPRSGSPKLDNSLYQLPNLPCKHTRCELYLHIFIHLISYGDI
jgi:hypothetical protein